jgi:hypothetical protein
MLFQAGYCVVKMVILLYSKMGASSNRAKSYGSVLYAMLTGRLAAASACGVEYRAR